jgi:hypothetical protein
MVRYAIRAMSLPSSHPVRQLEAHPILCEKSCAFGRWRVDADERTVATNAYQALAAPHADLHRLGKNIVDGIRSGSAIKDIAPMLSELKLASNELVRLLQDLEDDELSAFYGADTAFS